jgi:hypothetical protein
MTNKLIEIKPSTRKTKKYDAFFDINGKSKKVSFGAKGMNDYTITKDESAKEQYLIRHQKNEDWNDPFTAGALSRWILWNKPTLSAGISDYKKRFNL